jgi:hypothetical protein
VNVASRFIVTALSLTSTWGGFESYHLMRVEEFMSMSAIGFAFLSLFLILFGGFLAKVATA